MSCLIMLSTNVSKEPIQAHLQCDFSTCNAKQQYLAIAALLPPKAQEVELRLSLISLTGVIYTGTYFDNYMNQTNFI